MPSLYVTQVTFAMLAVFVTMRPIGWRGSASIDRRILREERRGMAKLSEITMLTLMALVSDDRLVVATLRKGSEDDWRAEVAPRMEEARFTVPIRTFRKMRRDGLLTKDREWRVSDNGLMHSEYILTDAGRAALAAAH
jgi:hypothetical protein